jgi:hypothetical protein
VTPNYVHEVPPVVYILMPLLLLPTIKQDKTSVAEPEPVKPHCLAINYFAILQVFPRASKRLVIESLGTTWCCTLSTAPSLSTPGSRSVPQVISLFTVIMFGLCSGSRDFGSDPDPTFDIKN